MKNKIIGYHGGGYSGCIWEPNFAYADKDGKIHDLYSSGRDGMFKDGKQVHEVKDLDSMQTYPVNQNGINKMLQDYRQDFIVGIVKILNDRHGLDLGVKCDKCGRIADAHEITFESYKGDGGIGIIQEGIVCPDCYASGTCQKCNEYYSDLNEYGLCSDCQDAIEANNPEIAKLREAMVKGVDQLAKICKLNPKHKAKYTRAHNKGCREICNEIHQLIQTEVEKM